ncbi:MAG: hypothetical protein A3K90_09005 [Pelodictyon luteolum]|uniref:RloB domain-containing protein n=1 Tax=Pelodictyon luteolum TaxID=1100 RepID=A0A165MJ73_PELLU|nr:MAG: hypothetical protein A3K90_09005 [Pelodictyon luteolum]
MGVRRQQRQVRKTLLAVGEGDSEVAFLTHLRDLYCSRREGVSVSVRNAHGKGPEHVIGYAVKLSQRFCYDACVVLLDTDIEWADRVTKSARKSGIEMVGSMPCLEGLLLAILGHRPPERCLQCKKQIEKLLDLDLMERQSYAGSFSRPVLDLSRKGIAELDRLLRCFEGC